MKKEDIQLITTNLKEQLEYYVEDSSDDEFDEVIEHNKKQNVDEKKDEDMKREIYEILIKEKRYELAQFIKKYIKSDIEISKKIY